LSKERPSNLLTLISGLLTAFHPPSNWRCDGGLPGDMIKMTKKRKLLEKVLAGSKNIQFNELVALVEAFGFTLSRVSGSHHIFSHPDIPEIVNLQNRKGKERKGCIVPSTSVS